MQFVTENWDGITIAVESILVAAVAVAALTPTEKDDSVLGRLRNLVTLLRLKKSL